MKPKNDKFTKNPVAKKIKLENMLAESEIDFEDGVKHYHSYNHYGHSFGSIYKIGFGVFIGMVIAMILATPLVISACN